MLVLSVQYGRCSTCTEHHGVRRVFSRPEHTNADCLKEQTEEIEENSDDQGLLVLRLKIDKEHRALEYEVYKRISLQQISLINRILSILQTPLPQAIWAKVVRMMWRDQAIWNFVTSIVLAILRDLNLQTNTLNERAESRETSNKNICIRSSTTLHCTVITRDTVTTTGWLISSPLLYRRYGYPCYFIHW